MTCHVMPCPSMGGGCLLRRLCVLLNGQHEQDVTVCTALMNLQGRMHHYKTTGFYQLLLLSTPVACQLSLKSLQRANLALVAVPVLHVLATHSQLVAACQVALHAHPALQSVQTMPAAQVSS